MKSRTVALKIVLEVFVQKKSLSSAFQKFISSLSAPTEKPLTQFLVYGLVRWYSQCVFIAEQLLEKPLSQKDQDIFVLILLGIFQLIHLRKPAHVIVNETVKIVYEIKKPWANGLVNAVLRNFIRRRATLLKAVDAEPTAKFAFPGWFIDKIKSDWPDQWEEILVTSNSHPPMSLRVNRLQSSRDSYGELLKRSQIDFSLIDDHESCVILDEPIDVVQLPGFSEGMVSVQDCGAQCAASLLDLQAGQVVLDACAAPGGKTMHILESEPGLQRLVACDVDEGRLVQVKENLMRGGLDAELVCADVRTLGEEYAPATFDRILLDAPCSGAGVIRRHPDIKWLRQPADIVSLAEQQLAILRALWPLLKPGGQLLYVTCSIMPEENWGVIGRFLDACAGAEEVPIDLPWGRAMLYGRQVLPSGSMDGFYYARVRKAGYI